MTELPSDDSIARVLAAYALPAATTWTPIARGLINQTYEVVADGRRLVLQRLNPIFAAETCANVRAVTEHLAAKGLPTPRVVTTSGGGLWVDHGGIWRMLTWIDGATFDVAVSAAQLHAAGSLVGRFHRALADLEHEFVAMRAGVHDLERHARTLTTALKEHPEHRLHAAVAELAKEMLAEVIELAPRENLTRVIGHGDLKLNNIRFAGENGVDRERALCLIDLDTVGPLAMAFELGDMWRSWCNPAGEDPEKAPEFALGSFRVSLDGYKEGLARGLTSRERAELLDGVEWISVELAIRFAGDALNESYFGWNPARHRGRGEHNLARARGQFALYRSARASRAERTRILIG